MITKIEVDGFKSLSNFTLKVRPGLNVLVGPNGAGKTNIIQFFEFLSKLCQNQIGYAVSSVGGAGAIFKKIGSEEYKNDINFKISGSDSNGIGDPMVYSYESVITTSFEKDYINYSYQRLKIGNATKFWSDADQAEGVNRKWLIDVEAKVIEDETKVTVFDVDIKRLAKNRFALTGIKTPTDKTLETIVKEVTESLPAHNSFVFSLFSLIGEYQFRISKDLIGGETFNIEPSKVKEQEDAANPPGINKDGSGLATTLYAIKKGRSKERGPNSFFYNRYLYSRNYEPKTLEKIVQYLQRANETILGLVVENDPFNNKLMVKIEIESSEKMALLPLSAMSDGTIKWLALITAILTSESIFSIEEPENFLHPWMQSEIAKIMRSNITEEDSESFAILTSHSESLLNSLDPSEVLIVRMNDGVTIADRIENPDLLRKEISKTGFGLGHYYFSNALLNE